MERYCPLCNRTTVALSDTIPPCVVITCAECGLVHAVRSLPEKSVHAHERDDPTPVFEPPPSAPANPGQHAPANTCTPSAAENGAPRSAEEPTPGDKVHRS
jgi:hypothetical protein